MALFESMLHEERLLQQEKDSDGEAQFCFAAAPVAAVLQRQCAAVRFGNLAAEDEADP